MVGSRNLGFELKTTRQESVPSEDSDKKQKGERVAAFAWTLSPLVLSVSMDYYLAYRTRLMASCRTESVVVMIRELA